MEKEHLLGKTLEELQTVAEENGLPRFAAKQIASWLYEKRIDHIAGMSKDRKSTRLNSSHLARSRMPSSA